MVRATETKDAESQRANYTLHVDFRPSGRPVPQPLYCSGVNCIRREGVFSKHFLPCPTSTFFICHSKPLPQKNPISQDKQLSNSSLTSTSEWNLFSSYKLATFLPHMVSRTWHKV